MSALTNSEDDDRTVVMKKGGDECENALPVGTRLFEFEIERLVGEGGFGIVYLANDEVLQRRVALKEYLPSSLANRGPDLTVHVTSTRHEETFQIGLRSFLNEARLLAQFDHPALVKVYRFWEAHGTAYMVMPFYEGATFKQAVQRDGPPDEARLRTLLHQLLDALDVLHGANCLHRDVAPDNVLMLSSNRPVLLDFGAARRVISDRTQALTVILKPGYAPIEQYAEIAGISQGPWTDVYALASVAHFAITGAPPPPSIARTLIDPYVPLEQAAAGRYSAPFLRAIDRALKVRPEDRPQSVAEFRALLGDAPGGSTGFQDARTIAPPPPSPPPRKRVGAGVWIGGAVALAAALGAGVFFYNRDTAVPQAAVPSPAPVAQETPAPKPAPAAEVTPAPVQTAAQPEPVPPTPQTTPAPPTADTTVTRAVPVEKKTAKPPAEKTERAARKPPTATARADGSEQPRPKPLAPAPAEPREPPAAQSNQLAAIAAAALEDGEKCLRARQYDCAIANANSALRVEPASSRAKQLKGDAEEAQRRALSSIKIE